MSEQHPIVAVTGACGAGTTVVLQAFKEIFFRRKIHAAYAQGDSFLRYSDADTDKRISQAMADGRHISCYGPELNDFARLESCFKGYAENGTEELRFKINTENCHLYSEPMGGFTDWQQMPPNTDCLFYEGMHGGVVAETWARRKSDNTEAVYNDRRSAKTNGVNAAQYVDLLIGVVPAINLEWAQRIHHHQQTRKLSTEQITTNILEQLQDYIHFIVPQFGISDINFQRLPVVDTSNPFDMLAVPTEDESMIVISFREPSRYDIQGYANHIDGAVVTRRNSLVIRGGQMLLALDVICAPLIEKLVK